MKIAIDILKEQINISKERLKIAHYPISIEPSVKLKIKECEDAIQVLDSERLKRTETLDKQEPKALIIDGVSNRIMALPLEKKHELLSMFFSNTKVVRKGSNEAIDFLKNQRRIVLNDELEKHGYLGSEMLAIKKILSLVYGC